MIRPGSFRIAARSVAPSPNANGSFSFYLSYGVLDHVFVVGQTFIPPLAIYVALYTAAPTPNGGGTEVSGGGYLRQPITFGSPALPDGISMQIVNTAVVQWPTATADWGFLDAAGLFDQTTAGNLLSYGLMLGPDGVTPTRKLVTAGDVFRIDTAAFVVGLA